MTAPRSDPADLMAGFAATNHADWQVVAERSVKGRSMADMGTTTADGIGIDVVYPPAGDAPLICGMPGSPPLVMPLISAAEPPAANRAILTELEGGADGFVLQWPASGPDLTLGMIEDTLAGVYLDAVIVGLDDKTGDPDASGWRAGFEAAVEYAQKTDRPLRGLRLNADPIGAHLMSGQVVSQKDLLPVATFAASLPDDSGISVFKASGRPAHEAGGSEAQELALMLASGSAYLRALDAAGMPPREGAKQIGLDLSADTDLFVNIAKLRAARIVWSRLLELCGTTATPTLHVVTSSRMMAKTDVHVNMLRTTVAALAAGLGGADSLTVLPFTQALSQTPAQSGATARDLASELARRVARNTMKILAQESYIGAVTDPARGAGHVEHVTKQLAKKAWVLFQKLEATGGLTAEAGVDMLRHQVTALSEIRSSQIVSGERILVGVNAFINPDDGPPDLDRLPA